MQAEGARFGLLRRQLRLAVGGELVVVARAGVARGARLRGQARLERRGAELGLARVVVAAHGAEALLARAGLERVHAQVLERQRQLLHLDLADRKWRWIAPARRPETRAPPPAESSGGGGGGLPLVGLVDAGAGVHRGTHARRLARLHRAELGHAGVVA